MALEFPNIRLAIFNRLWAHREDCVTAMVQSAYDLGLVPAGSLDALKRNDDVHLCGSMFAARKILEKYFEARADNNSHKPAELAEEAWAALERDVDEYKGKTSLVHNPPKSSAEAAAECSRMAPVVFDLLLQQLRRY